VLVDKPSDTSPADQANETRDWSERSCGSYLEWRAGREK
jgi:hypothetical protein